MPPKDRLAALKQNAADKDHPAIVNQEVKIEMSGQGSLDKFFAEVENMNASLDLISTNIGKMKQKHNLILSSPATDESDKNELEQLMEEIKKVAGRVRQQLKNLEEGILEEEKEAVVSANLRIRKTQQATLSRKFTTVMSEYNKTQTDYRDRCKGRIKRQLEITGRPTNDEQIDEMLESGNLQIFTEGIIADSQQAKQALADVEARHQDILKLETNIRELRDMFVDMALLVEAQGEMVDRIEYNVVNATEFVAQAKVQTGQAAQYQSSARRKKIWCFVLLLILIGIRRSDRNVYSGDWLIRSTAGVMAIPGNTIIKQICLISTVIVIVLGIVIAMVVQYAPETIPVPVASQAANNNAGGRGRSEVRLLLSEDVRFSEHKLIARLHVSA
ncbi:Syntaxin-1A [Hypsibius exemplaris]|uniref:Syntaxin-1A n=1 Tax=Hypsibius exemplaris TaxID=2072580 RepID=A0A9X6NCM6_HYPEX|nr:Syntaxin-1A [Hypsibius exemplaris]